MGKVVERAHRFHPLVELLASADGGDRIMLHEISENRDDIVQQYYIVIDEKQILGISSPGGEIVRLPETKIIFSFDDFHFRVFSPDNLPLENIRTVVQNYDFTGFIHA